MKLRKLTLHNVRRFAGKTATLGPFGDGLTTITAENESGKSTFVGALQALIFYDYGSGKKELKEMQPYSGGAMRISAQVEIEGADYLIEKVFNLKKAGSSATITSLSNGSILKQADDAELWIQQNILTANNGPFGLLWVRQGAVEVDAGPDGIDARRDVMSSVRGQIDAVTGGRRMDSIVQRCKQELDAISTKQDKPKAGSQWKEAEDRVALLHEMQGKLVISVESLGHDLGLKKRTSARLRELNAPELRQLRTEEISEAAKQLTATLEHDRKLQEAEKDIQLLENTAREVEREIQRITDAQERRKVLDQEIKDKETAINKAVVAKSQAQGALKKAQADISDKEKERRTLSDALTQARLAERKLGKWQRLSTLSNLSQRLEAPKQQLCEAEAVLMGREVTKVIIDRVSDLDRRRDIAVETRKIHFSSFSASGDTAIASIDGKDVPNGKVVLIDHQMDVSLPGFGSISLRPAQGAGQGIEDPEALQQELEGELNAVGVTDVKAARQAYEARQTAVHDQQIAQTQIRALAPDGLDALASEWVTLCIEMEHPTDAPGPALGEATYDAPSPSEATEREITNLDEILVRLRNELPALQEVLSAAATALTEGQVLLVRLRADEAELIPAPDEAEKLNGFTQSKTAQAQKVTQARDAFDVLRVAAPDLSAAQAKHDRAVQADEEDRKEINRQERELARLNGAIHTQSEGAVEEKLAEVTGKLVRAQERAAQFAGHVKALRLLVDHLEAARADAQETYFEPVRNELLPLLRQLHAGAEFQIDADKLLIETITRNGVTDKVDVLSGGAFEQIAILTRLAFAKLFSKHGNHVPIILDDALVYTDDERISTMFNMLAQIARDQQIIVLSCRTRAFSDLGGERAFITQTDEGVEDRVEIL